MPKTCVSLCLVNAQSAVPISNSRCGSQAVQTAPSDTLWMEHAPDNSRSKRYIPGLGD